MEQLAQIIQEIYCMLNLVSLFPQDELLGGYNQFLSNIDDILTVLKFMKEIYESGAGGPTKDPDDPIRGGDSRGVQRGPRDHRGQRGRTAPLGWDGAP